jgi:hypothetical protein
MTTFVYDIFGLLIVAIELLQVSTLTAKKKKKSKMSKGIKRCTNDQ